MLFLALIFHMHQPYYKNLLTQEIELPWVRLHGVKDYLDMALILEKFPKIHQTINLVPSLLEQVEDYTQGAIKENYLELSYKEADKLTAQEKKFLLDNFFSINKERVISFFPRYYELYLKKEGGGQFNTQDYLDLQAWFNLSWIDPSFRQSTPELKNLVDKARFFTEKDKRVILEKQIEILKQIIPAYKKFIHSGQIEVTTTPYFHPILPLLYNTKTAKEANPRTILPKVNFSFPEDALAQIKTAVQFHESSFGLKPSGMWPSEESVSKHILPFFIENGVKWIVTDEAILFKTLKKKKRDPQLIYQPHCIKTKEGSLNIVFRDRNLSDLLGFVYHRWKTTDAVNDLMKHLESTALAFKDKDILVTIAMDGENAWEFYPNDGHDFLELLYQKLSDAQFLKTTTVSEYLKTHPVDLQLKDLAAGSWIFANFDKWMGHPLKVKGWEYLAKARQELEIIKDELPEDKKALAWKQIYALEGSDWFWWLGEDLDGSFDRLFRMHLANFYALINREIPDYLKSPLH